MQYEKNNKLLSQKLRSNMTKEEKPLWYDFLSTHSYSFTRQKPIGKYIVDFFCSSKKLIIELDGSQHYSDDGVMKDENRTAELEKQQGIKVLRFSNLEVNKNFRGCCEAINYVLEGEDVQNLK